MKLEPKPEVALYPSSKAQLNVASLTLACPDLACHDNCFPFFTELLPLMVH